MAPFNGIPTHSQQVALALIPKFAAAVSIGGSSYILFDVVRNRRGGGPRRRSDTYHRLLLGMSVCDLFMSGGIFLSTWPMPRNVPHVWGNVGTTATCTAQGFFEQFGVSTVMYSASLSVYYLITIRAGRSAGSRARLRRLEPMLHAVPLLFGLGTAVAALVLRLFNYGLWDCWIAPYPPGCRESWRSADGSTTCVRGDNASLYQWLFDLVPKWTSILIVTVNMVRVYWHVRKQEVVSERWSSRTTRNSVGGWLGASGSRGSGSGSAQEGSSMAASVAASTSHRALSPSVDATSDAHPPRPRPSTASAAPSQDSSSDGRRNQRLQPTRSRSRSGSVSASRQIAQQSYLYVGALWITWLPVIVLRGTQLAAGVTYYWMLVWVSLSIPTQGMWNVLVYLRPRWLQKRREQEQRRARARAADDDEQGRGRPGTEPSAFRVKAVHILKDLSVAAADAVREGDIFEDEENEARRERTGGGRSTGKITAGKSSHFDNFELEEGAEGRPERYVSSVTFAGVDNKQSEAPSSQEDKDDGFVENQ